MAALRLLSVLVITLLVLSDFAAARGAEAYPDPRGVIFVGLVLGELALVATWCACARRSWILRVAIAWACAAGAAWPLAMFSAPSWSAWMGLLLVYSAVIAAGWKVLLSSGWQWNVAGSALAGFHKNNLRPRQISLAWIMEAMTALSLALGVGSWLALPARGPWLALATIVWLASVTPLVFCALLLETQRSGWKLVIALLVPLGAALFAFLPDGPSMLLLCGVQALVLLLAASVLAVAGVKLESNVVITLRVMTNAE